MAGIPVSLAEVIKAGARAERDEIFVARAGKVTKYDPETNLADVKPMVKHALYKASGERVFDELPEIPAVPIMFPRIGPFVVTMPVPVGTPVTLLFLDVSHAEWIEGGELSEPIDAQRHALGWPVALLGFYPDNARMSSDPADLAARAAGMVLGEHDGPCRIEFVPGATDADDRIKIHKDATEFVALANLVKTAVETELAKIVAKFDGHVHTSAAAGSPTSGPLQGATPATIGTLTLGSVAAAKTKAK